MKEKIAEILYKYRNQYMDWLHGNSQFPNADIYAEEIIELTQPSDYTSVGGGIVLPQGNFKNQTP
jgi:hypothetical protein